MILVDIGRYLVKIYQDHGFCAVSPAKSASAPV